MSRHFFLAVAVAFGLVGCASQGAARKPPEQLYLALQVVEGGRTVAAPRLLGFEGRRIFAERRTPGAAEPDYRLTLRPAGKGGGYELRLDLELPSGRRSGRLGLLHGEERTLSLDGQTELKVMLMRVDSPEFRALMDLSPRPAANSGTM